MSIDIGKLRELAESATPGPWATMKHGFQDIDIRTADNNSDICVMACGYNDGHEQNAEFIAACNPSTILELIGELRRVREEYAAHLRDTADLIDPRKQAACHGKDGNNG